VITAQLVFSLAGRGSRVEHERETVKRGDTWYIFEEGPNFRTTWKVTSFDDNGLNWLKSQCRLGVRL
jgi:hypothetical protein